MNVEIRILNPKLNERQHSPDSDCRSNGEIDAEVRRSVRGDRAACGDWRQVSRSRSHVVIEADVTNRHRTISSITPRSLGRRRRIFPFRTERKTRVEIGNENVIREHCTIHRGSADGSVTKIGDKNFLMAGAHVGHNCEIGNSVIIANNCLLGGHVRVGRWRISRRRLRVSPEHARRTTRDHPRRVGFQQRHSAVRDRGRAQLRFRIERDRTAPRRIQRARIAMKSRPRSS